MKLSDHLRLLCCEMLLRWVIHLVPARTKDGQYLLRCLDAYYCHILYEMGEQPR